MILNKDELSQHLGKRIEDLRGKISSKLFRKVIEVDNEIQETLGISLLDFIVREYHGNRGNIRGLARKCRLHYYSLYKLLEVCEIPIKTLAEVVNENWEIPGVRERHAKAVNEHWKILGVRERHAKAVRDARLDPKNRGKYYLRTIQGVRRDVGYAKSTWEANLMRIFVLCGRSYTTGEKVRVAIPEKYCGLFKDNVADLEIDFMVTDPRQRKKAYEIMSEKEKSEMGLAKLEMLAQQHPEIKMRYVTEEMYHRLKRRFKKRINANQNFCGWEEQGDNLRSNPIKYACLQEKE